MEDRISISEEIRECAPDVALGTMVCDVVVEKSPEELISAINKKGKEISLKLTTQSLTKSPKISNFRRAYRCFGKDPSRYRVSSEALIRRILQGKPLYRVNNVVDINNLISISSMYSLGSYDLEKLELPIEFRLGKENEQYKGIGKGMINIENLPVFADKIGAFGSPTSDSERSAITAQTKRLLMFIISFSGSKDLPEFIEEACNLLKVYASAQNIQKFIVK